MSISPACMALAIPFAFALPALAAHRVQVLVEHAMLLDVGAGVLGRYRGRLITESNMWSRKFWMAE